MADGTIFGDRFVAMYERSAFFHMAGVAGGIHAVALHQLGTGGAMRIVAIGANYLAFEYRMMGGLVHLRALLFMTGETDFRLTVSVTYLVIGRMYLMTRVAAQAAAFMGAAQPQMAV